jgi:hypothetical protein
MDISTSASTGVKKGRSGFLGEVPSVLPYITLRLKDLKKKPEVIFIVNV